MIILTAIGAFFGRIWKWIRETAWVQPLLIVGIIFGIIFSIRPIVDSITKLQEDLNSSETYYHNFQKSLVSGAKSDADKLTETVFGVMEDNTKREAAAKEYGSKFFLAYVAESCAVCKESRGGFETLQQNFNNYITKEADRADGFKMYTIFADEVTSDTTTKQTAFVQYMDRNSAFFEETAGVGYNSDYYMNSKLSDSDLQNVESCDPDNFLTPTILLVDFTANAENPGVTEIFFGLSGDKDSDKAEMLADCWLHTGDFAIKQKLRPAEKRNFAIQCEVFILK